MISRNGRTPTHPKNFGKPFDWNAAVARVQKTQPQAVAQPPISAQTSDSELRQRAGKLSYAIGAPEPLVLYVLTLERRVAQLETSKHGAPHLANVERR
jgi:hypothetical protein